MDVPSCSKAGAKTKIGKGYQMKIGASEITDNVNVYDINRGAENYIYLYLSQGSKSVSRNG